MSCQQFLSSSNTLCSCPQTPFSARSPFLHNTGPGLRELLVLIFQCHGMTKQVQKFGSLCDCIGAELEAKRTSCMPGNFASKPCDGHTGLLPGPLRMCTAFPKGDVFARTSQLTRTHMYSATVCATPDSCLSPRLPTSPTCSGSADVTPQWSAHHFT